MTKNKILIPVIITVLSFSLAAALSYKKSPAPKIQGDSTELSVLAGKIIEKGWAPGQVEQYSILLKNSQTNLPVEKSKIAELPGETEKAYLYSILLKKEENFKGMFDSLAAVLPDEPVFFDYYDQLAFSANATGQFAVLDNKIKTLKLSGKSELYINAFNSLYKGEYDSARSSFLKIAETDTDNYEALYYASYMYRHTGNYDSSFILLERAVKTGSDDNVFRVKALIAEGTLNYLSANINRAEQLYKKALDISEKKGYTRYNITSLVNLGIIYDDEGFYQKAREYFSKALHLAKIIGDIENKAFALSEWGVSYTLTGNIIDAKEKYLQCFALYDIMNERLRLSFLSENIAKLYMQQFDYSSALLYFERGLDHSGDNIEAKVLNLTGMADVYANLSNYSKALKLYREAHEYSSRIKSLSLNVQIKNSIGSLNFNLNRYRNALNYFIDGAKESFTLGDVYSAADLEYKAGLSYLMIDSLNAAEYFLNKSLKLCYENGDVNTEALVVLNLASLEIKKNNPAAAGSWLNKADRIISRHKLMYLAAESCLMRADIYKRENNFSAAKDYLLKALALSSKLDEQNIKIEIYASLGELFAEHNLTEAADSYYKSAISSIDDISRLLYEEESVQIAYFSGKNDIYYSYADFLLKNNRYEEAFEIIDRSRSRSTVQKLDNLKLTGLIKDKELLSKLYDYEWFIHSGIYNKTSTDSVKLLFSLLKQQIIDKYPGARVYLEKNEISVRKTIQSKLQENDVLLSFYSNRKSTYIFMVTRELFDHKEINISQKGIKKYLADISPYYSIEDSNHAFFNQDLFAFNSGASNQLYKKLFREVFKGIDRNKRVIVIPSAELLTFPMEMLVVNYRDDDSPYKYSDKDYLLNHYSISYTPSVLTYIHQEQNTLERHNKSIVVGDPAINTSASGFADRRGLLEETTAGGMPRNISLLPLKYSSEEVREVQEIINADKVFLSRNATETNFKKNASYSSIIHLSTHSFLYNNQPVIFFSNIFDPENDGFLEAGEIASLTLNSDLVVLSSCNSGLGTIDNAEGILGMTKAFFEAGSRSVVVSLWEVNDKYTSRFMSLFYNFLKDGYGKSEALRLAKIEFIKKYSANPYYWGAFVLSGDCSEIKIAGNASSFPLLTVLLVLAALSVISTFFYRKKVKARVAA